MKLNIRYWLKLSLLNLLLVAFLGLLMRYKIGFEFPYFNQKNIQHAHSHFAFLGWVTHSLYILMLYAMEQSSVTLNYNKYKQVIIWNLLLSYAMLISFALQGYGFVSIGLSTASIIMSYVFTYYLLKDLKNFKGEVVYRNWFKAAVWFNVISSLGTFALAFMLATKNYNQNCQLASVYFYLHFQYNGFFIFACLGLILIKLKDWLPAFRYDTRMFWLFFSACVPAYFLSTLWAGLPMWLHLLVVLAAFAQVFGWILFITNIKKSLHSASPAFKNGMFIFLLVATAFSIKLLLQLGSTIPALSQLAFGFRPIVIAYLHLILLAVISVFLLNYMYTLQLIQINKLTKGGTVIFVLGVFLNELILAVQGIAAFSYTVIPFVNELLFIVAILLFAGIFMLVLSQREKADLILAK